MTKRVVLASQRAVPGGAQRALAATGAAMADRGWTVEALVGEPGWLAERFHADAIAVTVSADASALVDACPDVVVSMGAATHAWAGAAADAGQIPAAWWLELTLRDRPAEAAALAVPAVMVAAPTAVSAGALRGRAPSLAVEVIAPAVEVGDVDRDQMAAASRRRQLGIDTTSPTRLLVMVSRLDPIKGQDVAIDATATLVAAGRDVHLALVGGAVVGHEGDLAHRLRAHADSLGIAERVTLTGHVDEPGPWHAAADVSVQASAHEAFGLSVVEALAHASAVVASDTDGPRAILDGGRYGLLTVPGDPDALATAIAGLLDDDGQRRRFARSGPGRAAAFTPEIAATRWDAALQRAVPTSCAPGD